MQVGQQVVNVNEYELRATPDEFIEAISALARRTEADGHPGVLLYQFYVNPEQETAGAVIVYSDAAAWLAHHHMAYEWEEMASLQATVALQRLTILGPLDQEVEDWLGEAGLSFTHYTTIAAGFMRG